MTEPLTQKQVVAEVFEFFVPGKDTEENPSAGTAELNEAGWIMAGRICNKSGDQDIEKTNVEDHPVPGGKAEGRSLWRLRVIRFY